MDHLPHTITANDLLALIGTDHAPQIIDVCLAEDIAAAPWRIPTARYVPHWQILDALPLPGSGQTVVTVCQKGLKLSQGAAALLRSAGVTAYALEGGNLAWFGADHPRLALDHAPDVGAIWVLPATRTPAALTCAWVITRWYDPTARLLWVALEHMADVATRFDAALLDPLPSVSTAFAERGLVHPKLSAFLDSVDAGTAPGLDLIRTLPILHPSDAGCAQAALPFLDAAWALFCQSTDQEAA